VSIDPWLLKATKYDWGVVDIVSFTGAASKASLALGILWNSRF
jgi:hypothetical protein